MSQPTQEEIQQAVQTLNKLERGFLPFELFLSVADKVVMPALELVPVRQNGDRLEVLLTQRPASDPHWPEYWHLTGTIIRASDQEGIEFSSAKARVLQDELHGTVTPVGAIYFLYATFMDIARGRELDHVYYFETNASDSDVQEGVFFDVESLPEKTMQHHKRFAVDIARDFRSKRPVSY